jgi:hypothetical protein
VTGETPSAPVPASGANPPVEETESESVLEESVPPNEELQELLEAREDTRTWWEKTEDWGNGAWKSVKQMAGAVVDNPGDAGIGILKGLGNLPSDIANLCVMAGKQSPPGQLMENMARAMDAQALAAFDAADVAMANALAKFAANIRNSGYVDDIFELKGDAQKGGSVLSMFVPFGGAVKAVRAATKAKVAKTTKVAKTATTATKAARQGQGVRVKPKDIRFSQNTVSFNKTDPKTGKKYTYDDMVESMKTDGWKGDPVDVVEMPDGQLTSLDNTRIVAAREAGIDVKANIRAFDEPLSAAEITRFTKNGKVPSTWGDAVNVRIASQSGKFPVNYPYGSDKLPKVTGNPK